MTGKIEQFEDLRIWQKARELVKFVYQNFGILKDYGFRDQIQRASVSVMNNIAEGFERNSNKEFIRFLDFSKSSCGEVRSMSYIAKDLNYINDSKFTKLNEHCISLSKSIASLIRHLKSL